MLDGTIDDPATFAFVAELDDYEKWDDLDELRKANPNYGVSVAPDDLAKKIRQAKADPHRVAAFQTKHGNAWVGSTAGWLADLGGIEAWSACAGELPSLEGAVCYAGIDLARKHDLAAVTLFFPAELNGWQRHAVRTHVWSPEAEIERRSSRDQAPYRLWAAQGRLTIVPGNIMTAEEWFAGLEPLAERYNVRAAAYDPRFADDLVVKLQAAGWELVEVKGYASEMDGPMRLAAEMIRGVELLHGGCPVLRWSMANVVATVTPDGLQRPDKKKSPEKIDPVVAWLLAMIAWRAKPARSVLEDRDAIML